MTKVPNSLGLALEPGHIGPRVLVIIACLNERLGWSRVKCQSIATFSALNSIQSLSPCTNPPHPPGSVPNVLLHYLQVMRRI